MAINPNERVKIHMQPNVLEEGGCAGERAVKFLKLGKPSAARVLFIEDYPNPSTHLLYWSIPLQKNPQQTIKLN